MPPDLRPWKGKKEHENNEKKTQKFSLLLQPADPIS